MHFAKYVYRVFSIRRPRRLFQTWPGGPGVHLTPAVYSSPVFVKQQFFFYSLSLTKMYLANIPTAYYTLNKYLGAYFQLHLGDLAFNRENTGFIKLDHKTH